MSLKSLSSQLVKLFANIKNMSQSFMRSSYLGQRHPQKT